MNVQDKDCGFTDAEKIYSIPDLDQRTASELHQRSSPSLQKIIVWTMPPTPSTASSGMSTATGT